MTTALLEMSMGKVKTLPIKLHADVVEAARIVSAYRSVPMQDMLSDILRPILAKLEREEVDRRGRPARSEPKTRRPRGE